MSLRRRPPDGNVRRVRNLGKNQIGTRTNKADRIVQVESSAELLLTRQLDRDPTVLDFQSQPETFAFLDDTGKKRTYTPDFQVWRVDGSVEIHEVTLTERRSKHGALRREAAAQRICSERGWIYIIHTPETLPGPTEAANLASLLRYRPAIYYSQTVCNAAYDRLLSGTHALLVGLIRDIAAAIALERPLVAGTLLHLLWHGDISTDPNILLFVDGTINRIVRVWREEAV
jgi:hypothetical protein